MKDAIKAWIVWGVAMLMGCSCAHLRPDDAQQHTVVSRDSALKAFLASVPTTTMRYSAPMPQYWAMWDSLGKCLGLNPQDRRADFDSLQWYVAATPTFNGGLAGQYSHKARAIIVGLGFEGVPWLVMHEMAHAYDKDSTNVHPLAVYNGLCRNLVNQPNG